MDRLTEAPVHGIVAGVDAHTDTHDAAVLDDCGRLLGTRTFTADPAGYRQLPGWVLGFGPLSAIGIESTGTYAAGLVRHFRSEGIERSRSTSRTRTPAAEGGRATRSTPSWPPVTRSPRARS
jgi:hypothetical protein